MPIRFLYFDMGNVLLSFSHEKAAAQMAAVAGITHQRAWEIVFERGLEWDYERGAVNCGQFHHLFCRAANCRADLDALDQAGSAIFELIPRMQPLLAALRRSGRRMGVLSNTSPSHWRYVTGRFCFLSEFFCRHALSYEVGLMKPDPGIYEVAEEMAGFRGGEIFFTDDRPENVAAARARGWDAVLFTSPADLAAALEARRILVDY